MNMILMFSSSNFRYVDCFKTDYGIWYYQYGRVFDFFASNAKKNFSRRHSCVMYGNGIGHICLV